MVVSEPPRHEVRLSPEAREPTPTDHWRRRIAAWFRAGFRCSGLGLTDEEERTLRVTGNVELTDLTVTAYSMVPSGNDGLDRTLRTHLDKTIGRAVPPPPTDHPEVHLKNISITFSCK